MSDNEILQLGDDSDFDVGNSLEVQFYNGAFNVEVDNPWAGSTESGFGYTCHVRLSREDAEKLRDFLTAKLAEPGGERP